MKNFPSFRRSIIPNRRWIRRLRPTPAFRIFIPTNDRRQVKYPIFSPGKKYIFNLEIFPDTGFNNQQSMVFPYDNAAMLNRLPQSNNMTSMFG